VKKEKGSEFEGWQERREGAWHVGEVRGGLICS